MIVPAAFTPPPELLVNNVIGVRVGSTNIAEGELPLTAVVKLVSVLMVTVEDTELVINAMTIAAARR